MDEEASAPGTSEVVLALAGHVDHGKSALVGRLTGASTDRRDVERRRGLTVDLAHVVLGGGTGVVAVTDAPGHVDYLSNTLVGLAGATHVLLVVAADDGWMPQTEDHVRAATVLGVPVALAVVTKADLVDDRRVAEVREDVRDRLGAAGHRAPVLASSTVDGRGLDDVRAGLRALARPPSRTGAPRLWVDRAFHVEGRGQVATGTLTHGTVAVGDELVVAPSGTPGRVRSLQRHGRRVEAAAAPTRVAVDLARVQVARGDRLFDGRLPRVPATSAVDAWLWGRHDPGIRARGAWLLHVGSDHVDVDVRPLGRPVVGPGEDMAVHLRLARPLPLVHGDRFVLRDVGRRVVAGGGVVLDPAPPGRGRGRAARLARAAALRALRDSSDDPAAALVAADGGVTPRERVVVALADPAVDPDVTQGHLVAPSWREALRERVLSSLGDVDGAPGRAVDAVVADQSRRTGAPPAVVRDVIEQVDGVVRRGTRLVRADQDRALAAARQAALARLHARLRARPLDPPPLDRCAAAAGVDASDVDRLVQRGDLLRSGPYGFLPDAARAVIRRLAVLESESGPFTVAEARDALQITRRHAIPWMELLDRIGATVRDGDRRRLTPSAGSLPPVPARSGR